MYLELLIKEILIDEYNICVLDNFYSPIGINIIEGKKTCLQTVTMTLPERSNLDHPQYYARKCAQKIASMQMKYFALYKIDEERMTIRFGFSEGFKNANN